ncbi:phage gp46-like protein [Paraburkholderia sp. BL8N3]|nr:phage GP46 family protein [Paraburkholderia sp. BL8N3]TCK39641.1 phage gp46-like protein [Paraburkholderia sp. BL8N3]
MNPTDIQIFWDAANNRGDWKTMGPVLSTGGDLETAILVSLFTDRMAAPDDEIPDGSGDPRGWWGDAGNAHQTGSRLWLLQRAKQTTETLQRAYDYIAEALQWLIDDGIVARLDITVEWTRESFLGANVVAHQQDGTKVSTAYSWAWNGIS